jgi:hypothetical protein
VCICICRHASMNLPVWTQLYIVVLGFDAKHAVPLSNFTVLGGTHRASFGLKHMPCNTVQALSRTLR